MKKIIIITLLIFMVLPGYGMAKSDDSLELIVNEILEVYDNASRDSILKEINYVSEIKNIEPYKAAKIMYEELLEQKKLSEVEKSNVSLFSTQILNSSAQGDIFYETASTSGIAHGHVGIYYGTDSIVESVTSGVRRIARITKQVGPGARILRVSNTSVTQKNNAAKWANTQVGQSYSYNFATNRSTSCTGAKNCSKLVWCAYKETMNIDLDRNGGLGVYPKDIRDHSRMQILKSY